MSYDEELAESVRRVVAGRTAVSEKEMFGGIAFLLRGSMFIGIIGRDLMVRVGPSRHEESLRKPHVRPMDFTGRPMKGYVFVGPQGNSSDAAVAEWVDRAVEFVSTLPPKKKPAKKTSAKKRSKAKRGR